MSNNYYQTKRKNGRLHCETGPAFINEEGAKMWYLHGVKHRLDGPAVEWADGTKEWWVAGIRHRKNGFAIEYPDGTGLNCYSVEADSFQEFSKTMSLELWLKKNPPSWLKQ